jgi:hypothetical protein
MTVRMNPLWRTWSAALAVFSAVSGVGPHVNERAYSTPIFDTVRAIAGWTSWSVAWFAVSVCALTATFTLVAVAWRLALLGAIAVSATWLTGIVWEYVIDGVNVSPTGLGLWCWFVTSNLIAATSPTQFNRKGVEGGE